MSSEYVRDEILTFLQTSFPGDKIVDISGEVEIQQKWLIKQGISHKDPFIGVDYVGAIENTVSVTSSNATGKYRELGGVFIYFNRPYKTTSKAQVLSQATTYVNLLRGSRIGSLDDILIDQISLPNFNSGGNLQLEDGYISVTIRVGYQRDNNI